MNEKKSLAQLLRSADVYGKPPGDEKNQPWQSALLQQFDQPEPDFTQSPGPTPAPGPAPLQWHHIWTMAPAGLGLFLAGILVGQSPHLTMRLMEVPTVTWVAFSLVLSGGLFGWWKMRVHT